MKKILITTIILLIFINIFGLEIPKLTSLITDNAQIFSPQQKLQLEKYLRNTQAQTSSQIALLTIQSLEDENLEDYSFRVAEKWQLGQKELDNGILLLIAMKERKVRIEVGYGLESIITDLKSGYIIRNLIVPEFKRGNFAQGIANGLTAISGLITEKFDISDAELQRYQRQKNSGKKVQFPFGLMVFLFMFILGGFGRRRGRGGLFTALLLGSMLSGGRGNSSFGGGGFGGFSGGGGGFGGGGASGGW